jgi:hypothetical protein
MTETKRDIEPKFPTLLACNPFPKCWKSHYMLLPGSSCLRCGWLFPRMDPEQIQVISNEPEEQFGMSSAMEDIQKQEEKTKDAIQPFSQIQTPLVSNLNLEEAQSIYTMIGKTLQQSYNNDWPNISSKQDNRLSSKFCP